MEVCLNNLPLVFNSELKGANSMNANLLSSGRRWLLTLVVAAMLAVTAAYAPVVLDNLAGTTLITSAYASQGQGGCCC
jgi:hypothetical protein